ncbi:YfiR/HmsC family protein [Bacteroidota bacterium]
MSKIVKRSSLILLAVLFFTAGLSSQTVSEDWLKSEYTILLAGYINWPDEHQIDTFKIGVLASEDIFTQISLKSQLQTLKEKPFRVSYYDGLRDLRSVDILYVDEKKNKSLKKIFNNYQGQAVLIVTDSAKTPEFTMLNILGMSLGGDKPFQLNKANIDKAGLSVSPKILLVGGSEDDLRHIYRDLAVERAKLNANLDGLNIELAQKQEELTNSERKLDERVEEINRLVSEIGQQTLELTKLSDSVQLKQMDLVEKIRLLETQEDRIKDREEEINVLNNDIAQKENEIAERSQVIEKQLNDIALQTVMMKEQQKVLDNQKIQIERQKMVLYFFLILSVLIFGLGFVSYRAFQIKKRANRILREKNRVIQKQKSDIMNQTEEILSQRDALQEVNIKIEKQNKNITDSIYYALTIQQAMLPDLSEIEKLFESYVIYMPKDIVSGDFYWFSQRVKKRSGERYCYFAVVDCTGHGVPGGFLSMIGSRMLNAIVNEHKVDNTDQILESMDKRIRQALNQQKTDNDDGMDVCLCKITQHPGIEDDSNVYLSFSGAHRSLFLVRQGKELEVIRGDRRTIGGKYFNPNPFTKSELALQKGDRIYLTSDGLMDQHSFEREKFGTKRFINFLNENASLSMEEQKLKLEEAIVGFMKIEKQRDDITIMGIKL